MAVQAESTEKAQLLDMGTAILGVDPGSVRLGMALVDGGGTLRKTWTVKPPAGELIARQAFISAYLYRNMQQAREIIGQDVRVTVVIEEGIFGWGKEPIMARIKNAAIAGEIRGMVMAQAWRCGFYVRKMPVVTWKSRLTKAERAMAKDKAYVEYWREKLGADFRSPDEVDASLIGRRAAGL
jgi:Holliday junction resolvasome RuvABC endonuclease subunit